MPTNSIILLHYTASPVVGGVEAVMDAQARYFVGEGYLVHILAGQGDLHSLPGGVELSLLPLMDTQHSDILAANRQLEAGSIPNHFEDLTLRLVEQIKPFLRPEAILLVHNVFTKHFNLPLTAALTRLIEEDPGLACLAWCHDFSWTSKNSRHKVHPGYPWVLLRRPQPGVRYITVSRARQSELAALMGLAEADIPVIYNGVDPVRLLGLSPQGETLARQLGLLDAGLVLLMPVRITQAKNIELALRVTAELKAMGRTPQVLVTGPPDPHSPRNMQYYQSLLEQRDQAGLERDFHFIYELGQGDLGLTISDQVVGELIRLSDAVFLPSRREGFGMPVLEAGLAGIPVLCSRNVPAAEELGGPDVLCFEEHHSPEEVALQMLAWLEGMPAFRFRRRIRRELTWDAIYSERVLPLLQARTRPPTIRNSTQKISNGFSRTTRQQTG